VYFLAYAFHPHEGFADLVNFDYRVLSFENCCLPFEIHYSTYLDYGMEIDDGT